MSAKFSHPEDALLVMTAWCDLLIDLPDTRAMPLDISTYVREIGCHDEADFVEKDPSDTFDTFRYRVRLHPHEIRLDIVRHFAAPLSRIGVHGAHVPVAGIFISKVDVVNYASSKPCDRDGFVHWSSWSGRGWSMSITYPHEMNMQTVSIAYDYRKGVIM